MSETDRRLSLQQSQKGHVVTSPVGMRSASDVTSIPAKDDNRPERLTVDIVAGLKSCSEVALAPRRMFNVRQTRVGP